MTVIRIGTRTSTLALWQANKVSELLDSHGYQTEIVGISSKGDKSLGGDLASSVGQFIHAVDDELINRTIDIAVHSSKDVPVQTDCKITNLAYLERGCTTDLLIFPSNPKHQTLEALFANQQTSSPIDSLKVIPKSGKVGTVSGRRQSFLLAYRPDIIPIAVRGQVETRLRRLQEGRVDAIILAEVGLKRLHQINALQPWMLEFSAIRIAENDWPPAPGQGAISVHCHRDDVDKLHKLKQILNHPQSQSDVTKEREILTKIGGGCLYPAGIKVSNEEVSVRISPINWRELFCQGQQFETMCYHGSLAKLTLSLPQQPSVRLMTSARGPKLISTLNSNRLATILQNNGINVVNQPVLDLIAKPENWPNDFLDESMPRSEWPYLVLTSPFAARCAIEVAKHNQALNRIQWLAIGEGTARACFMRGVTVSICAKARDSSQLLDYINQHIDRKITLLIPRSNVASKDLTNNLTTLGFEVLTWIGYENKSKQVKPMEIQENDVLLLSSPSSARAWVENSLPIPKNILCMGKSSQEAISSLQYFANSEVEVLQGPTAEFVTNWWKIKRGD